MKLLLAAINAKYIHTSTAVRTLALYGRRESGLTSDEVDWVEFTINQHPDELLREIFRRKPGAVGFSCYLWNYELVCRLCRELRCVLPDCVLFLGGPEVSDSPEEALAQTGCDFVLTGEGEIPFAALCQFLADGGKLGPAQWSAVPGAVWRVENGAVHVVHRNAPPPPMGMDTLPFPYLHEDPALVGANGRIVYYECTRGCPFSCQYCLSGKGERVRFRSLGLVFQDFQRFLDARVPQVKLMDRTFNADKAYALSIWHWLVEHDNGVTNFHFELAAELLDAEQLAFLRDVRPSLFQFEIGVQSTHRPTLAAIRRVTLPEKLTPIVRQLQEGRNIHLHLDLIAGLPQEGYARFGESFNYVYSLGPDQLQLGFLKLLKGSGLAAEQEKYGLRASPYPPYEVVGTPDLNFAELLRLKMLAEMVERYYNTHRYDRELAFLVCHFPSAFGMFEALGDWYEAGGYHCAPHSKLEQVSLLRGFASGFLTEEQLRRFEVLALFDLLSQEKARKLPDWMESLTSTKYKEEIYSFFDSVEIVSRYLPAYSDMETRQILRSAELQVFPFDPTAEFSASNIPTAYLFDYREGMFPHGAKTTRIPLEILRP